MSISQIGNIVYINQNTPAVSTKVADTNAKEINQNIALSNVMESEKTEIEQVRPTEEVYKIDPKNEHEKKKNQQFFQEHPKKEKKDEKELENEESEHLLDIKI